MEANCLNLLYPEGTASYKAVYWHVKHASLMRVWPAALAEQTVTRRRKECAAVLQFSCIRLLRNTFLEKKTFIFPTALLWRCCAVFWRWLGASQNSTWTYWPGSFPWSSVWILFSCCCTTDKDDTVQSSHLVFFYKTILLNVGGENPVLSVFLAWRQRSRPDVMNVPGSDRVFLFGTLTRCNALRVSDFLPRSINLCFHQT